MSDTITRPLVTTWSARKAHHDTGRTGHYLNGEAPVTACNKAGTRAGERTARGPQDQDAIDVLPPCGLCVRRTAKGA